MSAIRLQKIIAQAGLASRREAERLIEEGCVQVNGARVLTLGAKADPLTDSIKVNGKLITRKGIAHLSRAEQAQARAHHHAG